MRGELITPPKEATRLQAAEARRIEEAKQRKLEEMVQELPKTEQRTEPTVITEQAAPVVKAETAQSVVNQFTKKWRNKPKGGILVIQSESDADALNLSVESMRAIGDSKAEGFHHSSTDTAVIIADNLERTSDVIRVALHESIVHSGLRNMLGADFEAELERIGGDIPENKLSYIAWRYELDLSRVDDRLEACEEYLAKYAPTRNPILWQRFLSAVRRALRAMGINEHLIDVFDKRGDIDELVDAGRVYMERGRRIEPTPRGEEMRPTPGGAELVFTRQIHDMVQKEVEKRVQERIGAILHRLGATARNGMPARLRNQDNQIKWKALRARNQEILSKVVRFAVPYLSLEEKIERATIFGSKLIFDSKTLNYGDWSAKMKSRYGEGIAPLLRRVWNESAILLDNIMRGKIEPLAAVSTKAEPEAKPEGKKPQRQTS